MISRTGEMTRGYEAYLSRKQSHAPADVLHFIGA